jgi:hypothetical protein
MFNLPRLVVVYSICNGQRGKGQPRGTGQDMVNIVRSYNAVRPLWIPTASLSFRRSAVW